MNRAYGSAAIVAVILAAGSSTCFAAEPAAVLEVDASRPDHRLFHSHLALPVDSGALKLYFPKWIPGQHTPSGQVNGLVNLKIGPPAAETPWRRDDVDMFAFHCDVPPDAKTLDVSFDFISTLVDKSSDLSNWASASGPNVLMVDWESLLLYPAGKSPDTMQYQARLRLPPGWDFATALPVERREQDLVTFKPVPLSTLIDSPVIAGRYFKRLELGSARGAPHEIDITADAEGALDMPAEALAGYRALVPEAQALFGCVHYGGYHFLLTLSDPTAAGGVEHHQSTDIRIGENSLTDPESRLGTAMVVPHEFVHSWNGKYRRPRGLATADYQEPMRGELLWVYEGLTQYLGMVLGARSGLWTYEQTREELARKAAWAQQTPGRRWRPLADTAVAAQLTYNSPPQWASMRRTVDFYDEGALIWLEADVLIRERTSDRRSLDDFCKAFFGGGTGGPEVKPYELDEVIAALNSVCEYDWKQFFTDRIYKPAPAAPMAGIERGGWKLVYGPGENTVAKAWDKIFKSVGLRWSLGLELSDTGKVVDVVPGSPGDKAGVMPGQSLIAVDGRKYSAERIADVLKGSDKRSGPIELILQIDDFVKVYNVDYRAGTRNPHLDRQANTPDRLKDIFSAKVPHPTTARAGS